MKLKTLLVVICLAISMIPIVIIAGLVGFQSTIALIALISIVTFSISLIVAYFITRPIENLTKKINTISKGQLDVSLDNSEIYEINNLVNSLNRVMASLKLAVHKVGVKKGEIFEDAVKAKEEFEKKHCDIINNIKGWAWETDKNGVITYCSDNITETIGYKQDEIIGKNYFDLIPTENLKNARETFEKASENNKSIKNLESWYINKKGEKIYILTNGIPFYDENNNLLGYRGVDIDITEEKIAKIKVKELNQNLSELRKEINYILNNKNNHNRNELFNKTNSDLAEEKWSEKEFDSILILDENANILDCNDNVYKKLGYSKNELLALNMTDFDELDSKEELRKKINAAKKKGVTSFKTIHRKKDGTTILVHENLQYDKDKDQIKCIIREDYSNKKSS